MTTGRLEHVVMDTRPGRVDVAAAERHAVRVEISVLLHAPVDQEY